VGVVEVKGLTKRFGPVVAVNNLSFTVEPGRVTGFLGPNGAGKTTTLRMILGLVAPTSGTATINGVPYGALHDPTKTIGAVLEASGFHPARSARDHLRVLALMGGIDVARVDQVLELVGLTEAARRKAGGFSLGMRQRLELAGALLGEPSVLILDEPSNGLDPAGILWLRNFLRAFAKDGKTVVVSSHLLAEVEQTVDDVVIVTNGRLAAAGPLAEVTRALHSGVQVRSADAPRLADALTRAGLQARTQEGDQVIVTGAAAEEVGKVVAAEQIVITEMVTTGDTLEDAFVALTHGEPHEDMAAVQGSPG
jgi:ABC-2 type transport system ATP-binding protein